MITPEEFFLAKEVMIAAIMAATYPFIKSDMVTFWILMSFAVGYMAPEYWLKGKIGRVKAIMTKEMPDAIDLLGLCVNAGLDFMLALKWVVESRRRQLWLVS
jgi:tight adherence protein C